MNTDRTELQATIEEKWKKVYRSHDFPHKLSRDMINRHIQAIGIIISAIESADEPIGTEELEEIVREQNIYPNKHISDRETNLLVSNLIELRDLEWAESGDRTLRFTKSENT